MVSIINFVERLLKVVNNNKIQDLEVFGFSIDEKIYLLDRCIMCIFADYFLDTYIDSSKEVENEINHNEVFGLVFVSVCDSDFNNDFVLDVLVI